MVSITVLLLLTVLQYSTAKWKMQELDILVLGAGWTATFLLPLLRERKYAFAATTTSGHKVAGEETIKWKFDPDSDKDSDLSNLPLAKHVLITFPLTGHGQSKFLVKSYLEGHKRQQDQVNFIQLGSTGIWQIQQETLWVSRKSPYNTTNARAIAEDELLGLGGCVLNLAGLWGAERDPKNWVSRVAKTKEEVRSKKALHMIHGLDVARAIIAVMGNWYSSKSQRWMLTDGFVYDWWALFAGWADQKDKSKDGESEKKTDMARPRHEKVDHMPSKQAQWVYELMLEERVYALPRSMETLGRAYFGREFWDTFQLAPVKARI